MKAGDKVVCVDDVFSLAARARYSSVPIAGLVYVIRELSPPEQFDPLLGVYLVGITGTEYKPGTEWSFLASRFRPVAEVGHPPIEIHVMQPSPSSN